MGALTTNASAPTVLALLDNLFFAAKLNEAAKAVGLHVMTARTLQAALEKAKTNLPILIVVDLDAAACEPFEFIRDCKTNQELQHTPLLGFVSHVNTGVQQAARYSGCDRVVARSVFSRDLPKLLLELQASNPTS